MEHSKLPWESLFYEDGVIEIVEIREEESDTIAVLSPDTADNSYNNAAFIVKACNEHGALKAKVYSLEFENIALRGAESAAIQELNALKAKEALLGEVETVFNEAGAFASNIHAAQTLLKVKVLLSKLKELK